jgi:hypothetical protein
MFVLDISGNFVSTLFGLENLSRNLEKIQVLKLSLIAFVTIL